jgi:hypothetical protein
MRPELDPNEMTPDERRREIAAILAKSLRRLRDRAALANSENTSKPVETWLEDATANPLTVHVG